MVVFSNVGFWAGLQLGDDKHACLDSQTQEGLPGIRSLPIGPGRQGALAICDFTL